MGLDSVELLMKIEDYFAIRISNAEAERISTVQEMVDVVARHLNVEQTSSELQQTVFNTVAIYFSNTGNMQLKDRIAEYLQKENKEQWTSLEQAIGLNIPRPSGTSRISHKLIAKFTRLIAAPVGYDWNTLLVRNFVDVICARNYHQLIPGNSITSKYEIFIIIIAITVEQTGVEYFEVLPEKSFTNDLGVD